MRIKLNKFIIPKYSVLFVIGYISISFYNFGIVGIINLLE